MSEKGSKVCEACKLPIDDFVRYCSYCGSEQEIIEEAGKGKPRKSSYVNFCVNCNESISDDVKYCSQCGFDQGTPPSRSEVPDASLETQLPKNRTTSVADELLDLNEKFITGSTAATVKPAPSKSKKKAALLAILLGGFGVHKFYLGKTAMGIVNLIFSWTLIPSILSLIEGFMYLFTSEEKFQEGYS